MQEKQPTSQTVKLNVGGKVYEVSKSLLQAFPDTVLAKKVSTETSSPIFIDRDPDRFACVLDFMRDNGKVFLAETVTKAAFMEDLGFFGFADIDEALISNAKSKRQNAMRIPDIILESQKKIDGIQKEFDAIDRKLVLEQIALHCFKEFLKRPRETLLLDVGRNGCPFEGEMSSLDNFADDDYFRQCLDKFGLDSQSVEDDAYSVCLTRRKE